MKQIKFMGKLYDVPDNLEGQELLDFVTKLEDAANTTVAATKQNEIKRGAKKLAEDFDIEYDDSMSIKDVRQAIKDKIKVTDKKKTDKPDDESQQKLEQAYLGKIKSQKDEYMAELEKVRVKASFESLGAHLTSLGIVPNEIEPTKFYAMSQYKTNESGHFLDPVSGLVLTDKDQKPIDTRGLAEILKSSNPNRFQNPVSGQGIKPEFKPLGNQQDQKAGQTREERKKAALGKLRPQKSSFETKDE